MRPESGVRAIVVLLFVSFLGGCGGSGIANYTPVKTSNDPPAPAECYTSTAFLSTDPNRPVLTLVGASAISQPLGTAYVDAGATAQDPKDGDISNKVTVSGLDTLDVNTVGDYFVRYNVIDSAQLPATEVVRMVRVNSGRPAAQSARKWGSTAADMGYFEHLPVSYADDPKQTFPLIIYNNGWGSERAFGKPGDELSVYANTDMFQVIHEGQWDDTRPFVVLSPQRCSVQLADVELNRIKYFVDFAVNTYKVDPTRIYMVGMSAGAYYTWEYIRLNPTQLAAVVPISCGGSTLAADGCVMKQTPAWAFHAKDDPIVPYTASLATVQTINACQPTERVRYTLYPTGGHDPMPTLDLSGLGKGDPAYDIYDPDIYTWLLAHTRK